MKIIGRVDTPEKQQELQLEEAIENLKSIRGLDVNKRTVTIHFTACYRG